MTKLSVSKCLNPKEVSAVSKNMEDSSSTLCKHFIDKSESDEEPMDSELLAKTLAPDLVQNKCATSLDCNCNHVLMRTDTFITQDNKSFELSTAMQSIHFSTLRFHAELQQMLDTDFHDYVAQAQTQQPSLDSPYVRIQYLSPDIMGEANDENDQQQQQQQQLYSTDDAARLAFPDNDPQDDDDIQILGIQLAIKTELDATLPATDNSQTDFASSLSPMAVTFMNSARLYIPKTNNNSTDVSCYEAYYCLDCCKLTDTAAAAAEHWAEEGGEHFLLPLPSVCLVHEQQPTGLALAASEILVSCCSCRFSVALKLGICELSTAKTGEDFIRCVAKVFYHSVNAHKPPGSQGSSLSDWPVVNLSLGKLRASLSESAAVYPVFPIRSETVYRYFISQTCRRLGLGSAALAISGVALRKPQPDELPEPPSLTLRLAENCPHSSGGRARLPTQLANVFVLACRRCHAIRDPPVLPAKHSLNDSQEPASWCQCDSLLQKQRGGLTSCTILVPIRVDIKWVRHLHCAFCPSNSFSDASACVRHCMKHHLAKVKLRCCRCRQVLSSLEQLLAHRCLLARAQPPDSSSSCGRDFFPDDDGDNLSGDSNPIGCGQVLAACQAWDSANSLCDLTLGRVYLTLLPYDRLLSVFLLVPGSA